MGQELPVYMWEPLFNRLTRISTEYAHKVLGVTPPMLTRYIKNKTYNKTRVLLHKRAFNC